MTTKSKQQQPKFLKLIIIYTYFSAAMWSLLALSYMFMSDTTLIESGSDATSELLKERIVTVIVSMVVLALAVLTIYLFRKRTSLAISTFIIMTMASYILSDLLNMPIDVSSVFDVLLFLVFAIIDISAVMYLLRSKDVGKYLKSE